MNSLVKFSKFFTCPHLMPCNWSLVAMTVGVIASLLASPLDASAAYPVPVLSWQTCTAPSQDGFLCATAKVPVDYSHLAGKTFTLAVIKYAARDSGSRIGTLFWNPGGPGDAGTQYLPVFIQAFPEQIRRRFDIVSWDPRGMGGKHPSGRPVLRQRGAGT